MASSICPLQCGSGLRQTENYAESSIPKVAGLRFERSPKVQLPLQQARHGLFKVRAYVADEKGHWDGFGSIAKHGRRLLGTVSLACLLSSYSNQEYTLAAGLDKYLKRKKLDPLATYVPTVLLAQSQFQEVGGKLGGEQKTYADARSLLRTGPAASLRTDIRAVAQYAAESGDTDVASAAVDQCLSALEDLDSLLLQASRSQGAPLERMRKDLTTTVTALDRLLGTVPAPILEKAKAIAQAYKEDSY